MPPRTEAIKDFVIEGQPKDDSVRLVPEKIFSGYMFGGSMWRGIIAVEPLAREGRFVITVKDRYGEKQNPTLVFTVRVWADEAARNAHASSFLTRKTGHSPYLFAVGLALSGLLAGAANFLCGRLWSRHLSLNQCGEIYRVRHTERGTEITCELSCGVAVHPGMHCSIYRTSGEMLCTARVSGCENNEVLILINDPKIVRLGDVACLQPAPAKPDLVPDRAEAG